MVAGWDELGESRCADIHRVEGWARGDETGEKPAHAPETRRCSILSTMHRITQKANRRREARDVVP
jgi:hypothetical protein